MAVVSPAVRGRIKRALKWAAMAGGAAVLGLMLATVWIYLRADDKVLFDLRERTVNDVTQLNPTQVARVERPTSAEEVSAILRSTTGAVSIGGARCSMGGQVAEPGSLHLDMRAMNRVLALQPDERLIRVQAGITWRDVQDAIDPHDLSVKIMQTYSNFTVGGSLSVNAHGRYMGRGPLVQSIRAIRLVLANGEIVEASPTQRAELFYGAIGGYGGLGVIAEATLELDVNGKVKRRTEKMPTSEYASYFATQIRNSPDVVFHNGDLHPPDFSTVRAVSWVATSEELTDQERLIPRQQQYRWTPWLINGLAGIPGGFAFRKHLLEPIYYSNDVVTWRNHEASYDIQELEPDSREATTFVLREYFVPAAELDSFIPKMRDIFRAHDVQVVNVSIRHASGDPGTLLAWARGETFAFVVYYEQGTSPDAIAEVGNWSRELIDAVLSVGGTYYLPYQNHATREQFLRAYPRAGEFFQLKQQVDPTLRFQNSLMHDYGPSSRADLNRALDAVHYQRKPEGQTLLTIPEWYLVFNPVEYANHLEQGQPSDAFPFAASVAEYMSLYKKVVATAESSYPRNGEYLTMLRVIGISTAVEYLVKGAYETTLGRLFRATSSGAPSDEDRLIAAAQRAYSELIYDEPWYEFRFWPWVGRIWAETPFWGDNLLRRIERKMVFSMEYMVKAAYATVLGAAAKSAYEAPEVKVHLVVKADGNALAAPNVDVLQDLGEGRWLISCGRWNAFSHAVPNLAARGVEFLEIAGNDDIAVSILSDSDITMPNTVARRLLDSSVVSAPTRKRSVWWVRVPALREFLERVTTSGAQLEHLYDY